MNSSKNSLNSWKNPSLAKGFKKGAVPTNFNQQWENIASILNASGPPSRDGDGWQKVWRDLKFKDKKKMIKNKSEMRATGGGIHKYVILSPLKEAVANLLQFQKQINPEGSAYGVAVNCEELVTEVLGVASDIEMQTNVDCNDKLVEQEDASTSRNRSSSKVTSSGSMPTNSVPLRTATTVNRNETSDRQNLLEKHSNMQEKVLTEISNTLVFIKRNIKDSCSYQRKLFKVEQKKNRLMERREQRKNKEHEAEMKIKSLKIRIKEKKLRFLNSPK